MLRSVIASALVAIALGTPAAACTIVEFPSQAERDAFAADRRRSMIAEADLVYFGELVTTGGIPRHRYGVRPTLRLKGGQPPLLARTEPRYVTSCGRMPEYSLDHRRRVLPGIEVIVVARRRSWWQIEILEIARRDSILGRDLYAIARSQARPNKAAVPAQ